MSTTKYEKIYVWQAQLLTALTEKKLGWTLPQALYAVNRAIGKKQVDDIEICAMGVSHLVEIDCVIEDKVFCVALDGVYAADLDEWDWEVHERKSVFNANGEVKLKEDLVEKIKTGAFMLVCPPDDHDPIETLLQQNMRVGFEEACDGDDHPSTLEKFLAWDYFKYGWQQAILKYAEPRPQKRNAENMIYIEGWKNGQRVTTFNGSSDDAAKEIDHMTSFLELNRATRLRGVVYKPHAIDATLLTPICQACKNTFKVNTGTDEQGWWEDCKCMEQRLKHSQLPKVEG